MEVLVLVIALLVGGLAVVLVQAQHRVVHHGGVQVHLQPEDLEPNTRIGRWALLALLGAAVSELALGARFVWAMAPLGGLAALLALWALTRHQDRSPLTLLVLVVGLFAAFFPLTYLLLDQVS